MVGGITSKFLEATHMVLIWGVFSVFFDLFSIFLDVLYDSLRSLLGHHIQISDFFIQETTSTLHRDASGW